MRVARWGQQRKGIVTEEIERLDTWLTSWGAKNKRTIEQNTYWGFKLFQPRDEEKTRKQGEKKKWFLLKKGKTVEVMRCWIWATQTSSTCQCTQWTEIWGKKRRFMEKRWWLSNHTDMRTLGEKRKQKNKELGLNFGKYFT